MVVEFHCVSFEIAFYTWSEDFLKPCKMVSVNDLEVVEYSGSYFFFFLSLLVDQGVNFDKNTEWIWDVNSNFFEKIFSANIFAIS